jgi:hypothetical protein
MRFRSLAKRPRVETELEKELRYHIERQTEENIARGMNAREAREAASRMFGGVSQIEEECRDMRQTQYLEKLSAGLAVCGAHARQESSIHSGDCFDAGLEHWGEQRDF